MKIRVSLAESSPAELTKLQLSVIHLFTKTHVKCDRGPNPKTLIVHDDPKFVAGLLDSEGWEYDKRYQEWSLDGSDYILVLKGGGSATSVEFVYNG